VTVYKPLTPTAQRGRTASSCSARLHDDTPDAETPHA
jgi:hypothetical protein